MWIEFGGVLITWTLLYCIVESIVDGCSRSCRKVPHFIADVLAKSSVCLGGTLNTWPGFLYKTGYIRSWLPDCMPGSDKGECAPTRGAEKLKTRVELLITGERGALGHRWRQSDQGTVS